ncbi:hypothetical protein [Ancylobacter sp. TS-1]|uniref:phage integrase central domain-containing protein n=1 Tax=Ancylobacter sp. TS-1 TaxID=1850374 RepID=UPI001265B61D|nr:hypothetical protein [Ancylobacter sp. TS-1]QFR34410.1 hypothetical protein GBB76_15540 [Ancylobacter sp. TS-1]
MPALDKRPIGEINAAEVLAVLRAIEKRGTHEAARRLIAANHVIHLTRWWNPAVEEQCNDRTHRIGQGRPVTVHIPLAVHPRLGRNSFDCLLQRLMTHKRGIADAVLWPQESGEMELRQLYQEILNGDEAKAAPTSGLSRVERPDLDISEPAAGVMRIAVKGGGASILVTHGIAPESVAGLLVPEDAAVISLAAAAPPKRAVGLPLSVLPDASLWPDYILPN